MYAIKMESDKSLTTTIKATIYQGEKNADTLVFIVPMVYEETNLADCTLLLRYVLPNGVGYSEELAMYPIPYNKDYYQFRLSVDSHLTEHCGEIDLWLTAINFDDSIILHTGNATVTITQHEKIEEHLPPERLNQLDEISLKLHELERTSANNLKYDTEAETMQLTHNGVPVGDLIDVSTMVNHNDTDDSPGDEQPPGSGPSDAGNAIYF